ncbi:glutathione-regulated potassium-efflux system protein KefC [Pandoraea sp.]|uniref:glutathione-regulated potassium-efflux system protein KefC n=1 Tax=Pandoraea sp. TaxID=1883445 RepID=UPI00120E21DB|nr:glutathione-regulated potassium-efflux system protein KefC [Pandoraea sp.]TAL54362.1 MAG: glutathione-regulated potassium-efflux system protein KefC [Pandoraea sp.]TAM17412.1 MAG: glutathione-regulated potassium-efflux system protein KefC [Pandoraea sp.]
MEQHAVLTNVLIYFGAAVAAVAVARAVGLGSVLGYLIAGVAIGPWALGLVRNVQTILHFSEFGVVMMMFLIGLELEPRRLWSLRRGIFGYGGLQMVACALAIYLLGVMLGASWRVALVAALGLSLSSTAIALAILGERNLRNSPAGTVSFGILLFQDIAAIPLIALLPLLGGVGTPGGGHWTAIARAVAVIAAVVLGGRFLLRPALRKIAALDAREIFTAFALFLVAGLAYLMQSVGVSMALGTFLGGVLLADSEYKHALEADIEPFKGLLLGLFFMAVGMSIDFGIFVAHPWQVIGLVLLLCVIKTVVLTLISRVMAIARPQRLLFAFVLSQGGEFAFVVFAAAAAGRIIPAAVASLLTLVVALSMVMTPLLMVLHDRLIAPRANRRDVRPDDTIASQHNPVLIAGFGRFGQIVGRLLYSQGIGVTVLDHDPDQIDLLREFGLKVFYGDAGRMDLLDSAGAAEAKILVVAIDGVDESLVLIDRVRERFPHLRIYCRARNVSHIYQLMDRQVHVIERETFESSLRLGRAVLEGLGHDPFEARSIALKFRRHNIDSIGRVYPFYKNRKALVSSAREGREELEEMFRRDRERRQAAHGQAWF